jgi:transposase InsO family protein
VPRREKKKRIKYILWKSLAFVPVNSVTTDVVIEVIDNLIKIYGKPKQILTDNGGAYGLKSKHSKFDRKLRKRGIEHIRGAVHNPTTQGKVKRLFQTFKREIKFCNNDLELFRMRYNHFRPHMSLHGKRPTEIYDDFSLLF